MWEWKLCSAAPIGCCAFCSSSGDCLIWFLVAAALLCFIGVPCGMAVHVALNKQLVLSALVSPVIHNGHNISIRVCRAVLRHHEWRFEKHSVCTKYNYCQYLKSASVCTYPLFHSPTHLNCLIYMTNSESQISIWDRPLFPFSFSPFPKNIAFNSKFGVKSPKS